MFTTLIAPNLHSLKVPSVICGRNTWLFRISNNIFVKCLPLLPTHCRHSRHCGPSRRQSNSTRRRPYLLAFSFSPFWCHSPKKSKHTEGTFYPDMFSKKSYVCISNVRLERITHVPFSYRRAEKLKKLTCSYVSRNFNSIKWICRTALGNTVTGSGNLEKGTTRRAGFLPWCILIFLDAGKYMKCYISLEYLSYHSGGFL